MLSRLRQNIFSWESEDKFDDLKDVDGFWNEFQDFDLRNNASLPIGHIATPQAPCSRKNSLARCESPMILFYKPAVD